MTCTTAELRSRAVIAELRRRRVAAGLSQRALARKIGVTHDFVRRIEANLYGRAKIDHLMDYAAALGLELDFVVKSAKENDAETTPQQTAQA